MITADQLREKYLEFFRSKKHKVAASDSLVPKDDPTVLFTPAGMNQFKKQFLGMITDFARATSSQRCLRTDDLDKVGKTDCHHTFFEMLGNFSFGDYFKEDAIAWAWEFLTKELNIPAEKLWVSVYKDDEEAYNIWKDKVKFPAEKIVKLGDHDNFWPADAKLNGPNGPCGPCSEIFFDLGPQVGCGKPDCNPSCGCGRFIEVWNLVFTQFNRKDGGVLEPLPQKNIDTGMGLERITAVMQGVRSNFETDLFQPLVKEIKVCAKHHDPKYTTTIYAVCDHLRAIVFSIFDGIMPSNEARGYVVRKLIRKSVLHLRELGIKEPFLYKLVPVLAEVMKKPYPELAKSRENIADIILSEEKNFIATLNSSDRILEEVYQNALTTAKKKDLLDLAQDVSLSCSIGATAFRAHDTHGLPLELTKNWLKVKKVIFSDKDQDDFDRAMNEQRARSKAGSAMQGDVFSVKELELKGVPDTAFAGYEGFSVETRVFIILKDNREVTEIKDGDEAKIILDRTVFYAEQGGQIGDTGILESGNNIFEVLDTQKNHKVILHVGKVKHGSFKKGQELHAKVDPQRRLAIMRNHTATHLLQAALRIVLGNHVQQQGSFVSEGRLRFDFTHFKQVSRQELDRIEELVNSFVIENLAVSKIEMSLEDARKQGALAFFAEKYEDKVRVVSIKDISKEFCGGTHLDSTGFIGMFKIISESSIASGVRRIEALTGAAAYKAIKAEQDLISGISEALKTPGDNLLAELEKKLKLIKDLEKQINSLKLNNAASSIDGLLNKAEVINGSKVIVEKIDQADMAILRTTADMLKNKEKNVIVALGSIIDGKPFLLIATNVAAVDAAGLIKAVAAEIGGSGGGRKDMAQAGGTKPENLEKALAKIQEILRGNRK
ncbi:MAG: alanine--tRNA ligase [Candidatus Omnitrophica bacterium]|nr:alanine--tRNA ligase [Candidatus Omnitrophota bacterium]